VAVRLQQHGGLRWHARRHVQVWGGFLEEDKQVLSVLAVHAPGIQAEDKIDETVLQPDPVKLGGCARPLELCVLVGEPRHMTNFFHLTIT